jgi:hypothetical protein
VPVKALVLTSPGETPMARMARKGLLLFVAELAIMGNPLRSRASLGTTSKLLPNFRPPDLNPPNCSGSRLSYSR